MTSANHDYVSVKHALLKGAMIRLSMRGGEKVYTLDPPGVRLGNYLAEVSIRAPGVEPADVGLFDDSPQSWHWKGLES